MDNNMEQHKKAYIIKAIIIVVLFSGCLFFLWRERLNRPEVNGAVPVGEESTLVVKTVNESTEYTNIDAQIPQFTKASKAFNQKIETSIRERITEHKKETEENWQARIDTQGPEGDLPKIPTGDGDKMYFYAKFDAPEQNNSEYISVLTRFGGYTGGAHPYEEVVVYNYDVKNKKEMVLADLFPNDPNYLTKISEISRNILINRFTESFGGDFDTLTEKEVYIKENLEPMLFDGTNPTKPENFSNFTFNKNKLIIHFGQYQVAPYVAGLQDVEIALPLQ